MRALLAIAITLAALPAWAFDGRYEGQATFMIGKRNCPTQGPALSVDVHQDGTVTGGAQAAGKPIPVGGTVSPDGRLTASYKGALDGDVVTIEATLTNERLEGFSQSPNCRYKLNLIRR